VSTRESTLKKLDSGHRQGIRLVMGLFKSSHVMNLRCEAGINSLAEKRRQQNASKGTCSDTPYHQMTQRQ
jgi:hypothetical protein